MLARTGSYLPYTIAAASASYASPAGAATSNGLVTLLSILCFLFAAGIILLLFRKKASAAAVQYEIPLVPHAEEIVEGAKDAIFVIQESGEILSTNPSAERLFGFAFGEVQGKSIAALIPPPARGRKRANYIHDSEGRELFGVRKSGARFPLDISLSPLAGPGPKRFSVIVRDRSERNRAELEMQEQQRFAASVVEHMPALLVVVDHECRILRFNRACEDMTQFSEGEIRGQYLWQAVASPDAMDKAEAEARELLAGDFPSRSESVWCLRDNSLRTIAWTHNALRDEYGRVTHVISIGIDATTRLQLEERRRESEALSAAGRVAGGVAHDFNNLLTAITGYSGLVLGNLADEDPVRGDIEEIKRASDRGASITRQLLTFSGKHPRKPQAVDLNQTVRGVERLLRVMAGDNVHVDLSLEPNLPAVMGDPQQLEEAIMQLAANAKDAMKHGGTLQVQTGVRSLNRTRTDARPPLGPGDYVTVSVVDTGAGIEPDALPHLFEPFFTTKDHPRAKGMGLAIVYGIVRQAGGSIVVHSAPKFGSTFRLFLPLAPNQKIHREEDSPADQAQQGDETVLLAIESDHARKNLRDALEPAGYSVLEARSALQALEIAHKSPHMIHLLIADVVLPRMGGLDLAASIRDNRPAIRVLFASARSEEEIAKQGVPPSTVIRLDGTPDDRALLRRVRDTLAAEQPL
ncbi:MAG: PAS domain S-box protein [Acidobacteria bacterium]|nr:PAS domain S-box protein [Acidobacteriota bacterium]